MLDNAVELYARVRSYLEKTGLSQGDIARIMGLPVRKFNYYLTEKSQVNLWPLLPKLLQNDKKLSRDWLYFGEGLMLDEHQENKNVMELLPSLSPHFSCGSATSSGFSAVENVPATASGSPIRLTGLTECGLQGWFSRAYRSVNVSPPRCGEHWVVVQAIGDSMVPRGIMEGYTLFCDPSQPAAMGEAVYVLRRDGHATVKLYQGRDAQGRIILQGWKARGCVRNMCTAGEERLAMGTDTGPSGGAGTSSVEVRAQEAYSLYCPPTEIALLAPVIYIKCRL